MRKEKIYCVQSGLGKTYFCQHNLGWIDVDEAFLYSGKFFDRITYIRMINNYVSQGWKVLTSASPRTIDLLRKKTTYDIVLIYADWSLYPELYRRIDERESCDWNSEKYKKVAETWYSYFENVEGVHKIKITQKDEYLDKYLK